MNCEILKNFIVFEGIDGTGTTTQIARLKNRCQNAGIDAYFTFEPTESEIGKLIRLMLKGQIPVDNTTLAYLFASDRSLHLYSPNGIIDHCNNGIPVICDRYVFSSLAYQGVTCNSLLPETLNSFFPLPEFCIYFSITAECADERIKKRNEFREIFENIALQQKIINKFNEILLYYEKSACKIYTIDASKTPEEIEKEIWNLCMPVLMRNQNH